MSMIERVARALCRLDGHPENATMDGKPLWRDYEPEARAAIGAMREPSEEMISALGRLMVDAETEPPLITKWQAMITAALGEK